MMHSTSSLPPPAARSAARTAALDAGSGAGESSAGQCLFETVHWYLRDGFCDCVAALGRATDASSESVLQCMEALESLVDACEMLHRVELEALVRLRCEPDSSLANEDLLWAARAIRKKLLLVRQSGVEDIQGRLRDLQRYVALFLGELLVQLHVKEAEVEELLRRQLHPAAIKKLSDDLAEVSELLHVAGREDWPRIGLADPGSNRARRVSAT